MRLYLLLEDSLLLLQSDVLIMLDRDHDGVNSLGDHGSVLLFIMHRHLRDTKNPKRSKSTPRLEFVIITDYLQFFLIYLIEMTRIYSEDD